jgi:hypothetical protein
MPGFANEASDVPLERQEFQINCALRCVLGRANTFLDFSQRNTVRVPRRTVLV